MSATLTTYLTYTQRLLSDPNNQYWSTTELTDDINQARVRVAGDTKCLRQLITSIPLATSQELYNIPTAVNAGTPSALGQYVLEVISVTIYWGNLRVKCQNRSFTEQDAKLRIFQNYQTRPGSLAMMGGNSVYLNPVPDQNYVSDWDCVIAPAPLTNGSQAEVLPLVFQPLVPFYAAHLAKYSEQSLGETDIFLKRYYTERMACMYAFYSARWRDAYRR